MSGQHSNARLCAANSQCRLHGILLFSSDSGRPEAPGRPVTSSHASLRQEAAASRVSAAMGASTCTCARARLCAQSSTQRLRAGIPGGMRPRPTRVSRSALPKCSAAAARGSWECRRTWCGSRGGAGVGARPQCAQTGPQPCRATGGWRCLCAAIDASHTLTEQDGPDMPSTPEQWGGRQRGSNRCAGARCTQPTPVRRTGAFRRCGPHLELSNTIMLVGQGRALALTKRGAYAAAGWRRCRAGTTARAAGAAQLVSPQPTASSTPRTAPALRRTCQHGPTVALQAQHEARLRHGANHVALPAAICGRTHAHVLVR